MTLFLREMHHVIGEHEDAFEAAYRDGYMPALAAGDDARLLWYCNQSHGSGHSYRVVTVTAVADGAYERLVRRVQEGDLRDWAVALDGYRYDVEAKAWWPLPWSPIRDIDLSSVPVDGATHELTMYMEDTMWPHHGRMEDYVAASGAVYDRSLDHAQRFLTIEAAFRPAFGAGLRREVTLMQQIHDLDRLRDLLGSDIAPELRAPGTWMHDALKLRDQWESRLLRTSDWSPFH